MPPQHNSKDDSEPIYNFYSKFPRDNQNHIEDLNTTPTHKPQVLVWVPSLTYVVYMHRALKNVIITLLFEWSMPFFHPFNFFLLITVFPTLIIGIILLEVSLHVGLELGLGTLLQKIADEWGEGLSIVNWWDPRIFTSEVDEIVKDGIKALDAPLPPPLPEEQLDDSIFGVEGTIQHRGFHLDIAELLLFMSCIIYERDDEKVRSAHKLTSQITKERRTSVESEEIKVITDILRESECRIHEQASRWGLTFTSLSELNSLGGPFSGMFWSEHHNFIVVVFKGTTPLNFEDFVVDLMFQRVDARSFVFGEVHEGFYTSLFPQNGYSTTRSSRSSPYISMIRAIRAKAADIQALRFSEEEKVKTNVYVTGHSLGAALASLFYSRLVKSPGDLGPNCVLRDGYMFGSPSIGDADFAAEFTSLSNSPYDRHSTLWRIIDDSDIVTKLPPGWNDPSVRRVIDKSSILNYAHVGEGIRFFQDGSRPASTRNLFSSGKEPVIVERANENYGLFEWYRSRKQDCDTDDDTDDENEKTSSHPLKRDKFQEYKHKPGSPLPFVENLLPTCFRNHLPARYFSVMQRSRKYFDSTTTTVNEEDNENFASGSKSFKEFANKHINKSN